MNGLHLAEHENWLPEDKTREGRVGVEQVRNRFKALIGETLFEKSGSNRARFKAEPPRRFHEGQRERRRDLDLGSIPHFFFVRDRLLNKAAVVDQEDDEINTCGFVGDDLELGASLLVVDGDIDVMADDSSRLVFSMRCGL